MSDVNDQIKEIPLKIGEYTIGPLIGNGAFGSVFKATHSNREDVAIKIIAKKIFEQEPDYKNLINSEIELLKRVNHRNIIQLLEVLEDANYICIIIELCEKGELLNYIINKTVLSEDEARRIFQSLISALNYLNGMDICHRDIKPENILLTDKGEIKLIDFGFGTKYSNTNLFLNDDYCTPAYACPEIHKNQSYIGALADIWSTGVVLFAMVCGYLPFEGEDDEKISLLIQSGNYTIPKTLSPELTDLISNLLQVDPDIRYTYEDIIQHPWFQNPVLPNGIDLSRIRYPIDEDVLDYCEELDLNRDEIISDLYQNKFNNGTAIYKMIVKRMIKENMPSTSDFCSDKFKEYIEDPNNYYNVSKINNDDDELLISSPSGKKVKAESNEDEELVKIQKSFCNKCGSADLTIYRTKKFECIVQVANDNFCILNNKKEDNQEDKNKPLIQLIGMNNDESGNLDDSQITESSNGNIIISSHNSIELKTNENTTTNTSTNSLFSFNNSKPLLRRTDSQCCSCHSNNNPLFNSPIKQRQPNLASFKSVYNANKQKSELNSSEQKQISNLIREQIHVSKIDNNKMFTSPIKIRNTRTSKNNLSTIKEINEIGTDNDFFQKEIRARSPNDIRNIDSEKAQKLLTKFHLITKLKAQKNQSKFINKN